MNSFKHIQNTFVAREPHPSAILCLLSVIKYYNGSIDPKFLTITSKTFEGVTKLSHLSEAAESVGFVTKGVRSTLEHLKKIVSPVILHISNDQCQKDFAVCYGYNGRFLVGIPAFGLIQYTDEEMMAIWDGCIMLYLKLSDRFVIQRDYEKRKRKWLISKFYDTLMAIFFFTIFGKFALIGFIGGVNAFQASYNILYIICFVLSALFSIVSFGFKQYGEKEFDARLSNLIKGHDAALLNIEKLSLIIHSVFHFIEYILLMMAIAIIILGNYVRLPFPVLLSIWALSVWSLLKAVESFLKIKTCIKSLLRLYDFCN